MTMLDAARREHVPSPPGAAGAAWHAAAAEELATAGRWEQAYQHLRTAVRLLNGQPGVDELDRLRRENAEAREQSRRDSLTATYNRRYLDERLMALVGEPGGVGAAGIAVALLDVDHFKQINDTHGHAQGDRALCQVAEWLSRAMRRTDMVARYGGEEFVILMPGTSPEAALLRMDALRREIAGTPLELSDGRALTVDFSAGIAGTPGDAEATSPKALLTCADGRLLAAKRAGRGRCIGSEW
jgi:diguanylate cyclase (GGDEF)-like protein